MDALRRFGVAFRRWNVFLRRRRATWAWRRTDSGISNMDKRCGSGSSGRVEAAKHQ